MFTSASLSRATLWACLISVPLVGCAYTGVNRGLGVLPPQPPIPLWMGPVHDGAIAGAAAVVPYATPGWVHVMVSIEGAQPGATYNWSLDSGPCSNGAANRVSTSDRYTALTPFSDGHASAEALVPARLASTGQYSVTVSSPGSTTPAACADLAYGGM